MDKLGLDVRVIVWNNYKKEKGSKIFSVSDPDSHHLAGSESTSGSKKILVATKNSHKNQPK